MEPLTIVGAALSVTASAIEIGYETYITVAAIRSAPENIKRLVVDLQGLYHILGLLSQALSAQVEKNRPDSLPVHMITNIKELLENCINVFKEISKIVQPFLDTDGKAFRSFSKGFKWEIGRKASVDTLQKALSNNKATLELAISTLNFFKSSQTVEMVQSLQRDVQRLRRQVANRDQPQRSPSRLPVKQSVNAQPDPYSLPMRRFLARTESVISSTSTSTRVTDAVFSDDVSEVTSITECTEISDFPNTKPEEDAPKAEQLKKPSVGVQQLDQTGLADSNDLNEPSYPIDGPISHIKSANASVPDRKSTWRRFRNMMKSNDSAQKLDSKLVAQAGLPSLASNPSLIRSTSSTSTLLPINKTHIIPPPHLEHTHSADQLPDSSPRRRPIPEGAELTKTRSTPTMPFHGRQSPRPSEPLDLRSKTTPLTTLASLAPPRNPYDFSGYGKLGDTPDDETLATDRENLLGSVRQTPAQEESLEQVKTDPHTPCTKCKDPVKEEKHYRLRDSEVWHTHCFRCSSCNILLQSDMPPPFVLKDDFLVCNSCAFNCQKCDERVENHGTKDGYSGTFNSHQTLATTVGQLDCPGLFFCHDCQRSIKNLRYVRNRQGIFCLGCHPTTMSEGERVRRQTEREQARPALILVE